MTTVEILAELDDNQLDRYRSALSNFELARHSGNSNMRGSILTYYKVVEELFEEVSAEEGLDFHQLVDAEIDPVTGLIFKED